MDNERDKLNSKFKCFLYYTSIFCAKWLQYTIQCNEIWYNAIEYHTLISLYIIKIYPTTVLYFVYTYTYIADKFKYCWFWNTTMIYAFVYVWYVYIQIRLLHSEKRTYLQTNDWQRWTRSVLDYVSVKFMKLMNYF